MSSQSAVPNRMLGIGRKKISLITCLAVLATAFAIWTSEGQANELSYRQVSPQLANPTAAGPNFDHVVIRSTSEPRYKPAFRSRCMKLRRRDIRRGRTPRRCQGKIKPAPLVLFMPGTGSAPSFYSAFLNSAAASGARVIGLSYFNSVSLQGVCGTNMSCYGSMRLNTQNGSPSPHSSITEAESVEGRLRSLIIKLDELEPKRNWLKYLSGNSINWPRIVTAGHSQGAAQAAFIGLTEVPKGIMMFAGPGDSIDFGVSDWPKTPHPNTPTNRFIGFVHTDDWLFKALDANWKSIGLQTLGGYASVDGSEAPYGDSHMLTTSVPAPNGVRTDGHLSIVMDFFTPKDTSGKSIYEPVWQHMIRATTGLTAK